MLVDTGFDPAVAARRGRECLVEPLIALRRAGLTPESVDDVVLIPHVPRVFSDPSTQLNPCEENCRHQKRHENAPDQFTSTRRSYSETQKRSSAHSPKTKRQKLISIGYSNFCSKLLYLIVRDFNSNRMTPQIR